MKSEVELVGQLQGFDDFVNLVRRCPIYPLPPCVIDFRLNCTATRYKFGNNTYLLTVTLDQVLEDVTQIDTLSDGSKRESKLGSMLLNGNNICLLIPGSSPEDAKLAYEKSLALQAPQQE